MRRTSICVKRSPTRTGGMYPAPAINPYVHACSGACCHHLSRVYPLSNAGAGVQLQQDMLRKSPNVWYGELFCAIPRVCPSDRQMMPTNSTRFMVLAPLVAYRRRAVDFNDGPALPCLCSTRHGLSSLAMRVSAYHEAAFCRPRRAAVVVSFQHTRPDAIPA
jgi:hypothetical protein